MKITIVIPAYNEEKRISKTIQEILVYLRKRKFNYEIIIVDDGSKDKTAELADEFKLKNKNIKILKNKENMGKGYSVKTGILSAKNNLILFTDADLSTPIKELDNLIKFIKRNNIVIASRNLKDSNIIIKQPFFRTIPGKIFPFLVNLITGLKLKDTQCGFKLFNKKVAQKVFKKQTISRWGFDVEMLYIAKKLGYSVKEVPVTWINSSASKLNVFKDPLFMFFELIKIRFNGIIGRYK